MTQQLLLPLADFTREEHVYTRALAMRETPAYRVCADSAACNTAELLATLIGGPRALNVALRLLEQRRSLHGVARAEAADLQRVSGIGATTAARLKAALEISRRLLLADAERRVIRSPAEAAALFQPLLMHREQEYLLVALLDTRNAVIGEPVEVYHGSLNTALLRVSEVFREAVRANAAGVIVAHNHPSADPSPSPEDVAATRALREAGQLLDIELLDHVIIGQSRWVSMKERGLGFT
jgi:DNA repair protein RadC